MGLTGAGGGRGEPESFMALLPIKPFPSFCSGTIKPHTIATGGARREEKS